MSRLIPGRLYIPALGNDQKYSNGTRRVLLCTKPMVAHYGDTDTNTKRGLTYPAKGYCLIDVTTGGLWSAGLLEDNDYYPDITEELLNGIK